MTFARAALHGRHPGQEAGGPGGDQKGAGDGGAAAGRESQVHGLEAAADRPGRGEKVDNNHTPMKVATPAIKVRNVILPAR